MPIASAAGRFHRVDHRKPTKTISAMPSDA